MQGWLSGEYIALAPKHVACGFLLLLAACEPLRNAQHDLTRLRYASFQGNGASAVRTYPAAPVRADRPGPAAEPAFATAMPAEIAAAQPVPLNGKSEAELRALLGPPTSEEETAPGKTWRYRDGRCGLDVQLYRDVSTRKFGTLSYEVTSDDNSNEGRRNCLAQLQSRGGGAVR